jgi:hypothetical protein
LTYLSQKAKRAEERKGRKGGKQKILIPPAKASTNRFLAILAATSVPT